MEERSVTCRGCGAEARPRQKFCQQCGEPLSTICSQCATPLDANARFCGECGTPVEDVDRPQPIPERRLVSTMFCDLVGFTPLSEHRDPEKVRELLTDYFDLARSVIEGYGGAVDKFIGDAVMGVWGSPVAHEDDAERAVRAGLGIVEALGDVNARLGADRQLAVRVGIHTGPVVVSQLGKGRRETLALGETTNVAARLQGLAAPDTVVMSAATQRLVTIESPLYHAVVSSEGGKLQELTLHYTRYGRTAGDLPKDDELYEMAKAHNIAGRSSMTKEELAQRLAELEISGEPGAETAVESQEVTEGSRTSPMGCPRSCSTTPERSSICCSDPAPACSARQ